MMTEERVRLLEMKNRRLERLLASGALAIVALGAVAAVKLAPIVAQGVVVKDESGATKIALSSDGTASIKGRLLVGDTDVIQRLAAVEENWKRSSGALKHQGLHSEESLHSVPRSVSQPSRTCIVHPPPDPPTRLTSMLPSCDHWATQDHSSSPSERKSSSVICIRSGLRMGSIISTSPRLLPREIV